MEHEVFVPVAVEPLRRWLADPGRVAGAVPGLQQDAGGPPASGRLKVRVGGTSITYRGALRITERNDGSYLVEGDATEARGGGAVSVALTLRLLATDGGTTLAFTGGATGDGRFAELDPGVARTAGHRLLNKAGALLAESAPGAGGAASGSGGDASGTSDADPGTGGEGSRTAGDASGTAGDAPGAAGDASGGVGDTCGETGDTSGGTADTCGEAADTSGETGGDRETSRAGGDEPQGHRDESRGGRDRSRSRQDESRGDGDTGGDEHELPLSDALDAVEAAVAGEGGAVFEVDNEPPAEAAHARRTMIGRSAEEVDHAPPHGRYAPVPAPESTPASLALRWAAPAVAVALASAIVIGRALRRRGRA